MIIALDKQYPEGERKTTSLSSTLRGNKKKVLFLQREASFLVICFVSVSFYSPPPNNYFEGMGNKKS